MIKNKCISCGTVVSIPIHKFLEELSEEELVELKKVLNG